jgi:hypothetical protein
MSNIQIGRTFDAKTIDSTGSFLVQQLELLEKTIHMPLQSFTWRRDVDVRSDVTMGHEFSSYKVHNVAAMGGVDPNKKSFASVVGTNSPSVALDVGKVTSPLIPWKETLDYSIFELESSMLLGENIDESKYETIVRKYNQDIDIMVYLGDAGVQMPSGSASYGLFNNPNMTENAIVASNAGATSTLWVNKTPAEILNDVNSLINKVWTNTGFTKCPNRLLISPTAYAYIVSTIVSSAGNVSILTYLENNSLSNAINGEKLQISPVKWLTGTGNGNAFGVQATDAMYAYRKEYDVARYPLVPIMGLPVQYRDASQIRPYVAKLGVIESVYVEATGLRYGIA